MPALRPRLAAIAVAASACCAIAPAAAQQLNVICSVQAEWCNAIATEFQRETGIKVGLALNGSGESIAPLIDYNFAKYGASAERKRLLERWDRDIAAHAK